MSRPRLPRPCLALVTDRRQGEGRALDTLVEAAVAGGVDLVQLREKDLPAAHLYDLALRLREVTRGRALFVVNDRLDVALAVGADGVHLPGHGLPVAVARSVAGPSLLIGRSVHRLDEAVAAQEDGADYVQLGTIFETASKPGVSGAGPGLVASVAGALAVPVLAIGGVRAENVGAVLRAGAWGAAVVSAILAAPDPADAARQLKAAMGRSSVLSLTVNGKPRTIPGPMTLLEFLQANGIEPRIIAVERNGEIVKRDLFGDVKLADGDVLEIVHMVGGG